MSGMKTAAMELETLEQRFIVLISEIFATKGYSSVAQEKLVVRRQQRREVDLVVKAPEALGGSIVAVELKMYRSERAPTALLDQAVRRLTDAMEALSIGSGILIITSAIVEAQRRRYSQVFQKIQIWDVGDLIREARVEAAILSSLTELLKDIQVGTFGNVVLALTESAEYAAIPTQIEEGEALALKLEASSSGKSNKAASKFELLCEEALKLLFGKDFSGWQKQARIEEVFNVSTSSQDWFQPQRFG